MKIFHHPLFRWIGTRRGEASSVFALIAFLDILYGKAHPADIFRPALSVPFWLFWSSFLTGGILRIWAAGILRKNQEVSRRGIYRLVRHPLYLGTLFIYFSFFAALGDPFLGALLLILMAGLVYYPRALHEEEDLLRAFPADYRRYAQSTPRFAPRWPLLLAALRDGGFSPRRAYENLGLKCLWGILAMPFLYELVLLMRKKP